MSLAKTAMKADMHPFKRKAFETAGQAAVAGLAVGGAAVTHKALKKAKGRKDHGKMVAHAGKDYHGLEKHQKATADKYFHAIKKHSPTLASDPIASWNTVQSFMKLPTSYGPGSIEQLQKIEKGTPSVFKRN